jgi:hypothetical protein
MKVHSMSWYVRLTKTKLLSMALTEVCPYSQFQDRMCGLDGQKASIPHQIHHKPMHVGHVQNCYDSVPEFA